VIGSRAEAVRCRGRKREELHSARARLLSPREAVDAGERNSGSHGWKMAVAAVATFWHRACGLGAVVQTVGLTGGPHMV
jgi:hypothetical protein